MQNINPDFVLIIGWKDEDIGSEGEDFNYRFRPLNGTSIWNGMTEGEWEYFEEISPLLPEWQTAGVYLHVPRGPSSGISESDGEQIMDQASNISLPSTTAKPRKVSAF